MLITKLTEISKQKYRMVLDEEIALVVYRSDLSQYKLRESGELSADDYERLLNTLFERAKRQFAAQITTRDMTIHQTEEFLKRKAYPESVIARVIELGIREHFLDDRRYAMAYASCYAGRKSKRAIQEDLKGKGVPHDLIGQALETVDAEAEETALSKLLDKKLGARQDLSYEELQKVTGFLLRKGFSYDAIRHAIRNRDSERNSKEPFSS